MNFDDIISMLLAKKDEAKAEYEARVAKIDELLSLAGYVEPVEEAPVAEEPVEIVEEPAVASEPVVETAGEPAAPAAFFQVF